MRGLRRAARQLEARLGREVRGMNIHERSEFNAWIRATQRKCGSAFEREVLMQSKEHLWFHWVDQNMKHGYHGPSDTERMQPTE